jgi:hypothetical protein
MSDDELPGGFDSNQQAYDTGMLAGHLIGKGIDVYPELENDIDYTPVIRIEIPDQLPIWVRVLTR